MIGKPSRPVRREAARKRTSTQLARRRAADPSGWLTRNRRLARDYERLIANSEAMITIAMIRLMAVRLAGQTVRWSNAIEHEAAHRIVNDNTT